MNQDTPALTIRQKDLDANADAFALLLESIPLGALKEVLDIRYGLGGWCRKIQERYPRVSVVGYEQDTATFEKAVDKSGSLAGSLVNSRFDPSEVKGRKFDLVCADFNTLTVLKRELLDEVVTGVETDRIIFTDVACSKLHLNYRRYGLGVPSLEQYWTRFRIDGYRLVRFVKRHHAASSALYVKKNTSAE